MVCPTEWIWNMNNLLNIKTPAEAVAQVRKADYNLSNHGIGNLRLGYWNLPMEALYEKPSSAAKASCRWADPLW